MIRRRAGPLDAAFSIQAVVADARQNGRKAGHFVENLRGVFVGELVFQGEAQLAAHPAPQVADYLPVGAAVSPGFHCLADALHPPFAVGEGAVLLGKAGGGQHHVGNLGRLVHEDVLHHQELQVLEQFGGLVQVRLAEQGILAGDVHGPDAVVLPNGLDDLGYDQAANAGQWLAAPRLLEAFQDLGAVALVAGQVVGDAAGVAAALDVVLPTQGRHPAAGAAQLARNQGQVQQAVGVGRSVDVLGDAHAQMRQEPA